MIPVGEILSFRIICFSFFSASVFFKMSKKSLHILLELQHNVGLAFLKDFWTIKSNRFCRILKFRGKSYEFIEKLKFEVLLD